MVINFQSYSDALRYIYPLKFECISSRILGPFEKGTKPTTGSFGTIAAHDALSGLSDFAITPVPAATEELPQPGSCPTGKYTAETHA